MYTQYRCAWGKTISIVRCSSTVLQKFPICTYRIGGLSFPFAHLLDLIYRSLCFRVLWLEAWDSKDCQIFFFCRWVWCLFCSRSRLSRSRVTWPYLSLITLLNHSSREYRSLQETMGLSFPCNYLTIVELIFEGPF